MQISPQPSPSEGHCRPGPVPGPAGALRDPLGLPHPHRGPADPEERVHPLLPAGICPGRRKVGGGTPFGLRPQAGDHLPGRGDEGRGPAVFYPGSRRLSPPGAGGPPRPRLAGLPPFTGGWWGYFSYDYLAYQEPTAKCDVPDSEAFQDVDLMLFDKVIAFDHLRQKIVLMVNMPPGGRGGPLQQGGVGAGADGPPPAHRGEEGRARRPPHRPGDPLFDRAAFCRMVEEAKGLHPGGGPLPDCPVQPALRSVYREPAEHLPDAAHHQPLPYMFYFSGTDVEVAGASPETLVKLEDGVLHLPPGGHPAPGREPRPRTRPWRQNSWTMTRNWPSTTCWWTWAATTWGR